MKIYLLLILAAFGTAALLSYTTKKQQAAYGTEACYVSCFENDVRTQFKAEASTATFASWHPDPLPFEMTAGNGAFMTFKTPDGKTGTGYEIKSPKKTNNYLFVIHEWYGLNDYIKQEAERLANELGNINVIALDLYDGKVASGADSAMKYVRAVENDRLENIIKGALNYAGPDARIFTIGWCFGGMWSLQAAILAGPQLAGGVMYYGRPENNPEKLKMIRADIIGFFGNKDRGPSPEMVNAFEADMKAAGKTLLVNKYDAGHGFANPSNPGFDKEATADAHKKTLAFIKARM